jgi:hypothetical protein
MDDHPAAPDKLLKLKEHNAKAGEAHSLAGVACDLCGTEMRWSVAVNRPNSVVCPAENCTGSGVKLAPARPLR